LANKAFHDTTDLVSVGRNVGPDILGVEGAVRCRVSYALHVVDLVRRPAIHAQRLDLRNVGAHFAMDGSAAHAEEDSKLLLLSEKHTTRK